VAIKKPQQAGFTLVELVIAIVALAALGAALASVFVQGAASSADPQIRAQARVMAEGYVEEVMLKAFSDPDGTETGESRATFDDICDYNAIGTENPTGQNGTAMASGDLSAYNVTVSVGDGTESACSNDTTPGGQPVADINVTVSYESGIVNYDLTSQRAEF